MPDPSAGISEIPNWDYWYSAPSLHGACSLDWLLYFTHHDNNQPAINRNGSEEEDGSTDNPSYRENNPGVTTPSAAGLPGLARRGPKSPRCPPVSG